MRTFTLEISKPQNADDFEDYCADVYSVVFNDPTPKRNGRSGQSQGGVDIFIEPSVGRRKGIQCKRYYETKITEKTINTEVAAADEAGWSIGELVIATTTASDSKLVKYVQNLSDIRAQDGKFKVSIEFWGDICNHINRHPILQRSYSPNAPGAVFEEIRISSEATQSGVLDAAESISALTAQVASLASQIGVPALVSSLTTNEKSVVSKQLDKIVQLVKDMDYTSAEALLSVAFEEFSALDSYHQARWYLLSGIVDWHTGDVSSATRKFDTAYDIHPDDDRISAGKVRGLLLNDRIDEALDIAEKARARFPDSLQVWLAWANTKIRLAQHLVEADLPARFLCDPDALQMMAISFHEAADRTLALAYAARALHAEGAGFYTWSNVLFIGADIACRDPFLATVGLLPSDVSCVLREVCEHYEPRGDRLWNFASISIISDVAANLAVAKLLLGDASACLAICDEAEARGESSMKFTSPRVYAHHALGELQKVVEIGTAQLGGIHISAQMMVAEAAAILGRTDVVRDIAAFPSIAEDAEAGKTLLALTWVAIRNSGGEGKALKSLDDHDFESETALVILNAAARIYLAAGEERKATSIGAKLATLVTPASPSPQKIQAADTFIALKDYKNAIELLSSIEKFNESRELQTRLLDAYANGGYRAKARAILDGAPPGWFDDESFLGMAVVAAQQANDWPRLKSLALRHRDRRKTDARAWDFWYRVALQTLRPAEVRGAFSEAPLELAGEPKVIRRLALAELQYGDSVLGMRRLYRLFRCNLSDAGIAAGYVTAMLTAEDIPWTAIPTSIGPGVAATLRRQDGSSLTLVVDPPDVGVLPEAQNYFAHDAAFAQNFVGKAVGDVVTIRHPMGEDVTYQIDSLVPASQHVLGYAHKLIAESVEPIPGFMSMSVKKDDGEIDLSQIHVQLKRLSESAKVVFDGYRQGRLTVGLCAQMLGRSPVDTMLAWGQAQPPLVILEGRVESEPEWRNPLGSASSCVLDCITLVELGLTHTLSVLSLVPHPIVSRRAYDLLLAALEEANNERPLGHASDVNGQLVVTRYTPEDRRRKVDLLASIVEGVERHCEIAPAYGPADIPDSFLTFNGVLDAESYDAVALCLEKRAELISIDARLRALARSGFKVCAVSPQAIIEKANEKGQLSHTDRRQYLMQSLVSNRTYVSVSSNDFLWMVSQAGWSNIALDAYAEVLGSEATLFESAVNSVCGIFQNFYLLDIQFGALACLVERLGAAIYRHPSYRPAAERAMWDALQRNAALVYDAPPWHPTLSNALRERALQLTEFVLAAFSRAKDVAEGTAKASKHDLRSLYCERRPLLLEF